MDYVQNQSIRRYDIIFNFWIVSYFKYTKKGPAMELLSKGHNWGRRKTGMDIFTAPPIFTLDVALSTTFTKCL